MATIIVVAGKRGTSWLRRNKNDPQGVAGAQRIDVVAHVADEHQLSLAKASRTNFTARSKNCQRKAMTTTAAK